jgi:hypothetical protein
LSRPSTSTGRTAISRTLGARSASPWAACKPNHPLPRGIPSPVFATSVVPFPRRGRRPRRRNRGLLTRGFSRQPKISSFDQAEPTPSATAPPAAAGLFNRRLSGVCSVESRSRFSRRLKCLSGEKTKFTLRNRDILLYPCVNGAPRGDGQKYRDGSSRDQFFVDDVVRERRWNSRNKAAQGLLEVGQINTLWSG